MKPRKLAVLTALAFGAFAPASYAATFIYDFSTEFSGGVPPAGSAPWATLSFSDVSGGVEMMLTTNAATPTWFIGDKGFDINYGANPGSSAALAPLGFTFVSGQAATGISKGEDSFKADGDGFFDIEFMFASSGVDRLTAGESTKYLITGSAGASSFDNTSLTGGGNGTWYAAIHAQNTNASGDSGWLGATPHVTPIPEPETYAMLLAGLGLMGFVARRRRKERSAV